MSARRAVVARVASSSACQAHESALRRSIASAFGHGVAAERKPMRSDAMHGAAATQAA
jgi:hypothetical protein